jgi:hypothetical protein
MRVAQTHSIGRRASFFAEALSGQSRAAFAIHQCMLPQLDWCVDSREEKRRQHEVELKYITVDGDD